MTHPIDDIIVMQQMIDARTAPITQYPHQCEGMAKDVLIDKYQGKHVIFQLTTDPDSDEWDIVHIADFCFKCGRRCA